MTKILKIGKRVVCLTMVMLLMIACLPLSAFAATPNIVIVNSSVNGSGKGSNVIITKDEPEEPKAQADDDAVDYAPLDEPTAIYPEGVTADGLNDNTVTEKDAVACVEGKYYYASLSDAFKSVTDDSQTVTILRDITENLVGAYLRGNIVTENGAKVTITLTNDGWVYCPYTFVLGENITLKVPYLFYYAGGSIIKGTVEAGAYYQRYAGTKLTIEAPGSLTVTSETFYLRYMDGDPNAGIYIIGDKNDSTVELQLAVAYFYQGMINAKDATIVCGTYWQTNETDGQGSANLVLDNSTLTVTVYDHPAKATGNSTVTLKNGSGMNCTNGGFKYGDNTAFCVDNTSSIVDKNGTELKFVAKIGDVCYVTLAEAVAAVQENGTITLLGDIVFTEETRAHNSGTWYDGLYYVGDKSFTLDLGGFTITHNGSVNDYLLNFKNEGSKANTITIKNGTLDAGTNAFCAICTSSTSTKQITINLENINVINNISNGSTIKLRGGAVLNVNAGTVITGKNSYLGIECVASTVNIYDGAEIYMNGTSSYLGCLVGACGGGTVNVYGGYGKGVKGGFIAMTSGGTINVYGGEWIANTDGTVGNNSNVYVLTAQNNKDESGYVGASIINVYGGTFRGGMDAWILNDAKVEKAELNISGGNFNANPKNYLEEGCAIKENNGIYTVTCLKGSGTAEDPYQIDSADDLILFRDSVNAGETKYSAPGVYVALTADIDLAGINWVGIGSAYKDHGFMGNFDGNGFKIQNLTITNPALDSDGYAYAGFFSVTEGTEKAENVIKNLIIENVTISTTGDIVAAAIAYPYYTTVENITVCGDINITGGNYTAGALAYTRRCVNASKVTVSGNEGSTITGKVTVGGVISDIQMNGGLTANYSNFAVSGVTIKGEKSVGGISGIICKQTLNGATVENVTLVCGNAAVGTVAGSWGDVSTIMNVKVENVTGATAVIGATYKDGKAIEAKIGDTYYATLDAALKAAQDGNTIELLAPIVVNEGETLTLDKNVTITYTSNVAGEDMITNRGTLIIDGATLVYTNTDTTASNVTVSTISCEPGSVLEVKSGVVKNDSANNGAKGIYAYAIDLMTNGKLGDVTATISGGEVISTNYMAIRQFNNGTDCKNTLTVTGGHIYGAKRAIQIHMDNNAAVLAISGGTIEAGEGGYALCLYPKTSTNISITNGTFIGTVYSGTNGIISGGIFKEAVYEGYLAKDFISVQNADGTYRVVEVLITAPDADDIIGSDASGTKKETVQEAIKDIQNNDAFNNHNPITENIADVIKTFEVILNNMTLAGDDKIVTVTYSVAPKDEAGDKVSNPSSAIKFRLPVPSSMSVLGGYVEVLHTPDGENAVTESLGFHTVEGTEGNYYVEITADNFSEFTVKTPEETPNFVAKIGEVGFTSLADALAAANKKDIIVLLADNDEFKNGTVVLNKGITLNLNGKTLEAKYLVAFKGNNIVDGTRGTGLLKVAKDSVMLSADNTDMAVYTGEGYKFASVKLVADNGTLRYEAYDVTETGFSVKFRPGLGSAAQEYLNTPNEVTASGMQIIVRFSWVEEDGIVQYQDAVYSAEKIATMYANVVASDDGALSISVDNIGNYKDLSATLILVSDIGVQVSQHMYTFKPTNS